MFRLMLGLVEDAVVPAVKNVTGLDVGNVTSLIRSGSDESSRSVHLTNYLRDLKNNRHEEGGIVDFLNNISEPSDFGEAFPSEPSDLGEILANFGEGIGEGLGDIGETLSDFGEGAGEALVEAGEAIGELIVSLGDLF